MLMCSVMASTECFTNVLKWLSYHQCSHVLDRAGVSLFCSMLQYGLGCFSLFTFD